MINLVLQTPIRRDWKLAQRFPLDFQHDHLILRVSGHPRCMHGNQLKLYSVPLGEKIEFQYAWLIFAFINIFFFVPFMALKWYGPKLRAKSWQSPPMFNRDL